MATPSRPPPVIKRENLPSTPTTQHPANKPAQPNSSSSTTPSQRKLVLAPIFHMPSVRGRAPPIKQENQTDSNTRPQALVKAEPGTSKTVAHTPRAVKKRSRSPSTSRILAVTPATGNNSKRAKTEDTTHRAPQPQPQKQNPQQNLNKKKKKTKIWKAKKKNFRARTQNNVVKDAPHHQSLLKRLQERPKPAATARARSPDYVFVPRGNVYVTRNCKRLTVESRRPVMEITGMGIRVPIDIYQTVLENEAATRQGRKDAVEKADQREKEEARACLLRMFPRLPKGEDEVILGRAWEKSSGRVGRTSKLPLESKVRKAVVAHVRHAYTGYEDKLQGEFVKNGRKKVDPGVVEKVKNQIWGEVNKVIEHWIYGREVNSMAGTGGFEVYDQRMRLKADMAEEGKLRRPGVKLSKSKKKALRWMAMTEDQRKEQFERVNKKKENKRLRKLEQLRAKETEKLAGNDKGKGKAPIETIVISDSENDVPVIDIESDTQDEDDDNDARNWDIDDDEDDDFFYAEELDDEDYMGSGGEYQVATRVTRGSARQRVVETDEDENEDEVGGEEEEEEKEEEENGDEGEEEGEHMEDLMIERHEAEETYKHQVVKIEDEVDSDLEDIESAYRDPRPSRQDTNVGTIKREDDHEEAGIELHHDLQDNAVNGGEIKMGDIIEREDIQTKSFTGSELNDTEKELFFELGFGTADSAGVQTEGGEFFGEKEVGAGAETMMEGVEEKVELLHQGIATGDEVDGRVIKEEINGETCLASELEYTRQELHRA